jgi:hypothetical protein
MDVPESLWLAETRLYYAQALLATGDATGARGHFKIAEQALGKQAHVGPQYTRLLADTRNTFNR